MTTTTIELVAATDEHHGVFISFASDRTARIVRVMKSGRDNGTIATLHRKELSTSPSPGGRKWGRGGRACPVPFDLVKQAIEDKRDTITSEWNRIWGPIENTSA